MNLLYAILFSLVALVLSNEVAHNNQEQQFSKISKECMEANKVPAEFMKKYEQFQFPDVEATRCYIKCLLEKMQFFDPKTGFNVDNLVAQLGREKLHAADIGEDIKKCLDNNDEKTDDCTWAFRGFKCFIGRNLPLVQEAVKN